MIDNVFCQSSSRKSWGESTSLEHLDYFLDTFFEYESITDNNTQTYIKNEIEQKLLPLKNKEKVKEESLSLESGLTLLCLHNLYDSNDPNTKQSINLSFIPHLIQALSPFRFTICHEVEWDFRPKKSYKNTSGWEVSISLNEIKGYRHETLSIKYIHNTISLFHLELNIHTERRKA